MKNKISDYALQTNYSNIQMSEYIDGYYDRERFHELCKQCNKYGALWSCPPYKFDVDDYINKYKYVHLIGTKILLSDRIIKETEKDDVLDCTYKILNEVRKKLSKMLLGLEDKYPNSISLFAGSCLNCTLCKREQNKPCVNPKTMRYSLESLGFDVSKTASELLNIDIKWANETLPEYFTLVSAFFTNEDIKDLRGFDDV